MGIGKFLLGAGAVVGGIVLAPVVAPVAIAAGATVAGAATAAGAAVSTAAAAVGTAAASTAVGSAIVGGASAVGAAATAATTAVASSAVGTAVGAGLASVGGAVGTAAGAVGLSSVATVAGTTAGATAVGAITTSAAVGAAGAASGATKMSKASKISDEAQAKYDEEYQKFSRVESATNKSLESLGTLKLQIWNRFSEFEESFNKIQNLTIEGSVSEEGKLKLEKNKLANIHLLAVSAKDVIKDGIVSLTSGQLIGAAASTGITSVATASTGTAIASLHGAAATNASLAALGGGSLASGGLGMAGGAVVANTLAFAPAMAIGGLFLNSHGNKSLKAAENALESSKKAVTKLKAAEAELKKLTALSDKLSGTLTDYDKVFQKLLEFLKLLVRRDTDANHYTEEELTKCYASYRMVEILHSLTTIPLFESKDGNTVLHEKEIGQAIENSTVQWDEYRGISS